jgi:hypothetical protein
MYTFATTQHDHTTQLRKVHIARLDTTKALCGYKDMMLNGGEEQTVAEVQRAVDCDPDGYLCGRCVKAFRKLTARA